MKLSKNILDHYREFSTFTNPGCYRDLLKSLPNDISELGNLVCHQIIHSLTLKQGNTGANADKRYGDMDKFPWWRLRCEDDVLMTTAAMVAELLRLDSRGFVRDRAVENKIVVTCRYIAVLMASILKSKGIPCRVRSGFNSYSFPDKSADHWINQYWSTEESRWINFDADGFFDNLGFDQFDIPKEKFDWAADSWLNIREGKEDADRFVFADGDRGLRVVIRAIFYDYHCLMNNEISYLFQPSYVIFYQGEDKFGKLTEKDFREIDDLARLMLDPDENFEKLQKVWQEKRKFRLLNAPLIIDSNHLDLS